MASPANNHKPKAAPVVVIREQELDANNKWRFLPAAGMSLIVHVGLLGLFLLLAPRGESAPQIEQKKEETPILTENTEDIKKDPFLTTDVDLAMQEVDTDINFNVDRIENVSVPGTVNPDQAVGIMDGDKSAPPTNLPAPGGFGNTGQGGAVEIPGLEGNSNAMGEVGGYGGRGLPLPGTFYGRSGSTREKALRDGGGTGETEAAVTRGLKWLARNQSSDGSWRLDGNFPDKGSSDHATAGTAFGLLPLLGAGKTHKITKDNPYDKPIEKALFWLIKRQDKRTGNLGGNLYDHGLATIALCEAFGLSQDYNLRKPAQMAINYIVTAQHDGGGWRYGPGQAGDTSVTGWQVMALKSGLMSGLDVPATSLRKAQRYLDSCCNPTNEGYGYTGPNPTYTMTAVALLCRQYLQSWGPQNIRMIKAIDNFIKPNNPVKMKKNVYYYYYATQVMHHFGGEAWKEWNTKMREELVKSQDKDPQSAQFGSWSSVGHTHCQGRLMVTSLNLLTLEVYYRYLPLYYRDSGAKMDNDVGKAL